MSVLKHKIFSMKILMVSLLHILVCMLMQLFPLLRVLKILNYSLHPSEDDLSECKIINCVNHYTKIILKSKFKNPTCLEAALMLTFFMSRQNIPTELCLGIAKSEGKLTAHAWLTFRGLLLVQQFQVDEFIQVFSTSNIRYNEVCRKF